MCITVKGTWQTHMDLNSSSAAGWTWPFSWAPVLLYIKWGQGVLPYTKGWNQNADGKCLVHVGHTVNFQAIFVFSVRKITCQGHRGRIEPTSSNHKSSAHSGHHLPLNHMSKLRREDFRFVSMWGWVLLGRYQVLPSFTPIACLVCSLLLTYYLVSHYCSSHLSSHGPDALEIIIITVYSTDISIS